MEISDPLLPPEIESFERKKLLIQAQRNNLELKLFEAEIEKSGFAKIEEIEGLLKDNYMVRFVKKD